MSRKDKIKFNHAVVLVNAVKLDIVTLDFRDASRHIACIAIYARLQMQNGEFSSQLIFGRSKLFPSELLQPRTELLAKLLNTYAREVSLNLEKIQKKYQIYS